MWRAYRPVVRGFVQKRSTSSQGLDRPLSTVQMRNALVGGFTGMIGAIIIDDDKDKTFGDNLAFATMGMCFGAVAGLWWPIAIPLFTVSAVKTYWRK